MLDTIFGVCLCGSMFCCIAMMLAGILGFLSAASVLAVLALVGLLGQICIVTLILFFD